MVFATPLTLAWLIDLSTWLPIIICDTDKVDLCWKEMMEVPAIHIEEVLNYLFDRLHMFFFPCLDHNWFQHIDGALFWVGSGNNKLTDRVEPRSCFV